MIKLICGILVGMALILAIGSNYHLSGVNSGVYLASLDLTDPIYRNLQPADAKYMRQHGECERSLIFQNLAMSKLRQDRQDSINGEFARQIQALQPTEPNEPNSVSDPNSGE